jgi:menaquinone-dependent protoporphyrinogen IX oxidase
MSKALIIYFSKYGTTHKYVEWIAEDLGGDIYPINNLNQNILKNYDTIILGSGLYAGKVAGLNILIKNYEILKTKKIVLFTCGLADYSKSVNVNAIYKRLETELPEKIIKNIKIFYLRGGIKYKKLNLKHKIMMWMLKRMTLKNRNKNFSDEDKVFIETYGKELDFTDRKNIIEIVEYSK